MTELCSTIARMLMSQPSVAPLALLMLMARAYLSAGHRGTAVVDITNGGRITLDGLTGGADAVFQAGH